MSECPRRGAARLVFNKLIRCSAQAPLDGTTSDFWSCISVHKVAVVVMLTTLVEKGKVKSAQYWPEENNELFGDHEVTLRSVEEFEYFTVRVLSLQSPGMEEREIMHIQVSHGD